MGIQLTAMVKDGGDQGQQKENSIIESYLVGRHVIYVHVTYCTVVKYFDVSFDLRLTLKHKVFG